MSQGLWRLYLIVNQMRFHSLSSSSSRDKARSAECPASLTHADRLTFVTSLPFVELPVEDGLGLTHEFFRGAIVQEMLIFSNCFSFWLLQEKLSLPHPDPTPLRHWELLLFHLGTSKKKKMETGTNRQNLVLLGRFSAFACGHFELSRVLVDSSQP